MKITNQTLLFSILISVMLPQVFAGDVTGLKDFKSGTKAIAADVNNNFKNVKTAVDNNNSRIKVIELSSGGTGDLSITLSGTVNVTAGTKGVIGVGTLFVTELKIGTVISILGETHVISSISDNTNLILATNHVAGAAGSAAFTDGDLLTLTDSAGQEKFNINNSGDMSFAGRALTITPVKMRFQRDGGNNINFTDVDGIVTTLNIVTNTSSIGNAKVYYHPRGLGGNGILLFNINASPTMSCTLLHLEDDTPRAYMYATDGGNTAINATAWGNTTTNTFMFTLQQGVPNAIPMSRSSTFEIICF
ncbi:MAG: hypothetical protein ACC653_11555 [Gammaproteobacteria bacterium]